MSELQPIFYPGTPDESGEGWSEQYAAAFDGPGLRGQLRDVIFESLEIPSEWTASTQARFRHGFTGLFDHLDSFEVVQLAAEYDLCMTFERWCARDKGDK